MKDIYYLNISVRPAGGNASKNAVRGSLNIPKDVLKDMGIDKENSEIELHYDEETKEIKIKKGEKTIFI